MPTRLITPHLGDKITSYTTYPSGEGAYTFTVMDKSKVILQHNFTTSVYQGKFALFIVEDPSLGIPIRISPPSA